MCPLLTHALSNCCGDLYCSFITRTQPHDAQVADGAPIEAVLTLGFYDAAECTVSGLTLADYTSAFDACCTQPSMAVVSDLLRELVSESD
jgi:hypothetical protein